MELRHFAILYLFIEWVILLQDSYYLWARPVWRFILATQSSTSATAQTVAARPHHATKVCRVKKLLGVDLKMIMDTLGICWDRDDKRQVITDLEEMLSLFHEDEPSLDEVKEAFSVFDRNNDGYIDQKELQNTLSEIACRKVSHSDCRRMINRYDVDKDKKISFREFLKLMEDCF
ncbi:putative calcium-binding protein CML46 [Bidens hawaiensis]|uniref:putative calcium-binding protein CML46 n=1 Tax=Bidens hawaiensis TaxID=980011 RepID=UPI00404B0322